MFRFGVRIAACLAFLGSPASACLWTQDSPLGEDYLKVESGQRVAKVREAIGRRPTDHTHLFHSFEYNPANPTGVKNDRAVQALLRGDAARAVEMLLLIESETPGKYFTAANLGTAYELAGDDESALRWILEGIKRNAASHMHTEWLHARILETKIKLKKDPAWLEKHTITEADFSKLSDPAYTLATRQRPVNGEDLQRSLWSQLTIRTLFVKPKDPIVAQLLEELARVEGVIGFPHQALEYLDLARQYGLPVDRLRSEQLKWKFAVGWNGLQKQAGSFTLLAFPAIAMILLWKAWKMLRG